MPDGISQYELTQLTKAIQEAVAEVPVLNVPANEVFVFYPPDLLKFGLGEELGAKVDGLFIKPDRTAEVLSHLADAICGQLEVFAKVHLPDCTLVEAFIASMIPPERCTIVELR